MANELLKLTGGSGTFCGRIDVVSIELTNDAVNFDRAPFEPGRNPSQETERVPFGSMNISWTSNGWHDGCLQPCVCKRGTTFIRAGQGNARIIHTYIHTHTQTHTCKHTRANACIDGIHRTSGWSNTHVIQPCGSFDQWDELGHENDYIESDCYGFSGIN